MQKHTSQAHRRCQCVICGDTPDAASRHKIIPGAVYLRCSEELGCDKSFAIEAGHMICFGCHLPSATVFMDLAIGAVENEPQEGSSECLNDCGLNQIRLDVSGIG